MCVGSSIKAIYSRISLAGQLRCINFSRASDASDDALIVATISSTLETVTASPQRIWLRSRAFLNSNAVLRATTSSRNAIKFVRNVRSVSCSGRPPLRASMLQPKDVCRGVNLNNWFNTTSGVASRFSSITTRTPFRSLSSCTWEIPSIFFSLTCSAIFSIIDALLTWYGISSTIIA